MLDDTFFENPDALSHGDKRIKIDTKEKYDEVRAAAIDAYKPHPFDADAEGDLDQRVRNGQGFNQIIENTIDDRKRRHEEE
jgi:hypothetical protein